MNKTQIKEKLEDILERGKYDYVNSDLTTKNFPIPDKIQTENWKLIRMEKSFTSQEALDEIKKQGCRPANAYELALWLEKHRDELKKFEWCLALGQLWFDGDYHRMPYVDRYSAGHFDWYLGDFENDWYGGDFCLLVFTEVNHKTIQLFGGEETIVDEDDYEKLKDFNWHKSSHGYACRIENIKGKKTTVYLHQEVNKTPSGFQTDHINRNKLDNRKENLKTVTWSENQENVDLRVDNVSGIKGVSKRDKKWQVHIRRNGKRTYLGCFDKKEDAQKAYLCFCDQNSDTLPLDNDLESLTLRVFKLEETLSKIKELL